MSTVNTERTALITEIEKLIDGSLPSTGIDAALRKAVLMLTADGVKSASTVEIRADYLVMFSQLMTEASETLQKMSPDVCKVVGLRHPLVDELDGAALMALDCAKSTVEVPPEVLKPVARWRPR